MRVNGYYLDNYDGSTALWAIEQQLNELYQQRSTETDRAHIQSGIVQSMIERLENAREALK